MIDPRTMLLTGFGLGLLRPASGTWGSTPPVILALGMVTLIGPHWTVDASLVMVALAFSIACVRFGAHAEITFGRKDPSQVVADEIAGQAIALLLLPWHVGEGALLHNGLLAGGAFVAFRVMDIIKPPPANGLQRLPGGWGILVDDLIAGVYALAVVQVVARLV